MPFAERLEGIVDLRDATGPRQDYLATSDFVSQLVTFGDVECRANWLGNRRLCLAGQFARDHVGIQCKEYPYCKDIPCAGQGCPVTREKRRAAAGVSRWLMGRVATSPAIHFGVTNEARECGYFRV